MNSDAQGLSLIERFRRWLSSESFLVYGPSLISAIVIAEMFYKWRSFTLEAVGFLITWYLIHLPLAAIYRRMEARARAPGVPASD